MTGYLSSGIARQMPGSVRAVRVILYVVAGMTLLLFAGAVILTTDAREVGRIAGLPFILGIAGAVLALLTVPGRQAVRVAIIVVEALWLLVALGRLGQGDPTGVITMVLPIVMLVLINRAPSRDFFRSNRKSARAGSATG